MSNLLLLGGSIFKLKFFIKHDEKYEKIDFTCFFEKIML